jgi:hypothetical protein
MVKKMLSKTILWVVVVTLMVIVVSVNQAFAQQTRSIVPSPRDIQVEPVDPATKMPQNSFCIGANTIDVKLTNNSGYRKYVTVLNRDTSGMERTLYAGWLESGIQYLSILMRTQLELTGPAGTEMVRVDVNDYGQPTPGNWVTFYVRDCGGGTYPPGPGGYAQLWAQIYPYAIEQGKNGIITLQTNVESQPNVTYYFEILNSWGQLWKRLPVSKRAYEPYTITLAAGATTKPGMLTYTVNLWQESGFGGRKKVATTYFSFRVITPGSAPTPYDPGYSWPPTYDPYGSGYPGMSGFGMPGMESYGGNPYSGMPYGSMQPYTMPQYGTTPYGTTPYGTTPYGTTPYGTTEGSPYGYYMAPQNAPQSERQIE